MPTVIDELVIRIAFDMEGLKKRGDDTAEQLKKIREAAEKTGKDMEQSGIRAAQFFSAAKTEALAFMAVLTGGAGLISSIATTAASIAGLGREAQNLNGMDPTALDAWGSALRRIGGDAANATASFNNIGRALANYKLRGDTTIIPFLNAIGAQTTQTPEQIALRFSQYIKEHPEKSNQEINVIGQGLGMTQDMTNLLRQGPEAVNKELQLSRELGLRTQDMIDTATKFQHDFTALAEAAEHLKDRFETGMMPTIDKVILALTSWIVQNSDAATAVGVGGAVSGGLAGTSTIARMLGLTGLADAFSALATVATKLAGVFGLLTTLKSDTADNSEANDAQAAANAGQGDAWRAAHPNVSTRLWNWITGNSAPSASSDRTAQQAGPRAGSFSGSRADTAAQASLAFWKSKGLSDAQAAGMAAQEISESGGNPAARGDYVNGQATAMGAYQWHSDRRAAILAGTGIDVTSASIEQQREAAYWEITHGAELQRGTWGALRTATTAAQAGRIATDFERPGLTAADQERERINRAAEAERISRLGATAAPPIAPTLNSGTYLLPPAGARGEDLGSPTVSPMHQSMDIGTINIHTAATDAHGIAKEIHGAVSDQMIQQANRGLA